MHEFGHLLTMWAPELAVLARRLASSRWPRRSAWPSTSGGARDRFAVILMVAWAAESLHNVSVYIGDAQVMVLPLFGDDGSGAGHDWHNILLAARTRSSRPTSWHW